MLNARLAFGGRSADNVTSVGGAPGDRESAAATTRNARSVVLISTFHRYSRRFGGVSARFRVNGTLSSTFHSNTARSAAIVALADRAASSESSARFQVLRWDRRCPSPRRMPRARAATAPGSPRARHRFAVRESTRRSRLSRGRARERKRGFASRRRKYYRWRDLGTNGHRLSRHQRLESESWIMSGVPRRDFRAPPDTTHVAGGRDSGHQHAPESSTCPIDPYSTCSRRTPPDAVSSVTAASLLSSPVWRRRASRTQIRPPPPRPERQPRPDKPAALWGRITPRRVRRPRPTPWTRCTRKGSRPFRRRRPRWATSSCSRRSTRA